MANKFSLLILLFCLFFDASFSLADNWQASIHENGAPKALVGVDKKHGIFNYFEKKSPLNLRYSYPCVTGQLQGDKYQTNDLKTPEGVYFVDYKIASGLDFKEYGGIAYTLNYPNPVDRLRGKTGHGIWIHSKGFDLVPTRGCVAIDLQNIAEVGPNLTPGTAVVVAEELKGVVGFDDGIPAQLMSLMNSWTNAWQARSEEMFDYYEPDSYSRATENFTLFKQNKERLFKILSYIKIFNREIHALEGPGYWVTWAEQLYTASNLSTEGIRRLYWQKDNEGRFRIVGMEWIPRDVGMRADFKSGKLVAEGPVSNPQTNTATDASYSEAPKAPALNMPEQAPAPLAPTPVPVLPPASQPTAVSNVQEQLVAISDPLVPQPQPKGTPPDEISWGIGRKLTEPENSVQEPVKQSEIKQTEPARDTVENVTLPAAQPDPAITSDNTRQQDEPKFDSRKAQKDIEQLTLEWVEFISEKNDGIEIFYDEKNFNRLPASLGIPRNQYLNTHIAGIKRDFTQPWLRVINNSPRLTIMENPKRNIIKSEVEMMVITPQGRREGLQTLWWLADETGNYKIVGASFKPGIFGLEANYLESIGGEIAEAIEDWRKAWEKAQIDDYISHYAQDATQQGRSGAKNIRRQKEMLWDRTRPTLVHLSGLRLSVDNKGIRADMNQAYADSAGKTDKGVKTILLKYDGKNWLIQKEDWVMLPTNPVTRSNGL